MPRAKDRDADPHGLLARVASGDTRAFGALYERYATVSFSIAMRLLGDQRSAEDTCQEAFLVVWRSAGTFEPSRGTERSWILAIVRNHAINELRRRSSRPREVTSNGRGLEERPARESTSEYALNNVHCHAVRETLRTLPDDQLRTLILAYYAGLSQTEIAELDGVPLGTVKGRTRLALEKLSAYSEALTPYASRRATH